MPLARNLLLAGAFAAGLSAATLPAAADDPIVWRMVTPVPDNSFFDQHFMQPFARNVALLTDGRVEIEIYGAGTLVPALEVHKAVMEGTVEAGFSTGAYLVNLDPANAILSGHPGGMSPEVFLHWIYEGGGRELWVEFREQEMGLHPLIAGIGTTEIFAHSNKPIRTVEDLQGLKHRTAGGWAEVLKDKFGGVPTVVPAGEIYTLLERKGIDSVEWGPPGSNLPEGFHRIAKYIILPGVHANSFPWEVVVKKETWDALPEELQEKLEAAAQLSTFQSYLSFGAADIEAMVEFKKGQNEIIVLDPALVAAIKEQSRIWAQEKAAAAEAAGKPWMARIFASYDAYQSAWAANAEYRALDLD